MPEVNTGEWLAAVDAHPETCDDDLIVATALVSGDCATADVEGFEPAKVADCVDALISYEFLQPVLVTDTGTGEEHILELRFPE